MKNKNNFKLILLSVLGLTLLNSCHDDLDLAPISQLTDGNFYKTEVHMNQALVAAYDAFQNNYNFDSHYLLESRSDNIAQIGPKLDDLEGNISQFNETSGSEVVKEVWNNAYNIIWKANIVINKVDASEVSSEAKKTAMKSQARFLRAAMYLDLVRMWGDVPLVTKSLGLEESFTVKRTPASDVLNFIITEFTELASASSGLSSSLTKGQPTIYAAHGLLARTHLWMGNHSLAAPHLKGIMDSGVYAFNSDFAELFKDSNDNGKHIVFAVQYDKGIVGEENGWPSRVLTRYIDGVPFAGSGRDLDGDMSLWNAYTAGDKRRDLTLRMGFTDINDGVYVADGINCIKMSINNEPAGFEKWGIDWPILRYTDVMMMYAECLNEASYPSNEAFTILNQVRTRAGLATLTATDLASKTAFADELMLQRRLEFAYEDIRWFDLVRTGRDKTELASWALAAHPYADYRRLFPIPADEIAKINDSSIMWQNPGY